MNRVRLVNLKRKSILLLSAVIGATCIAVFYQYIFGNKILAFYDIGSDTVQQYLSQYSAIIRKITEGDFTLWDADNGFGVNMNMLNMTNPALIILYFLGAAVGLPSFPYLLVWLYIAEIIAAGIACYLYLSVFPFDEKIKCMVSYMYAFSGFMIVWGQHYQFAVVPTLVALELLMIERCIRDARRWPAVTVMTFILVFNSMYIAYMTLAFCALYVVVRFFMRKLVSFKKYVFDVFRLAWPLGLGVGLGFITLLPSISAILSVSSRLASNETLVYKLFGKVYTPSYYAVLFGRLFSGTARGVTDYNGVLNYYEDPCLFFSTLFIILLLQYLFLIPKMKTPLRNKILQYLIFAFFTAAACSTTVGTIMNGMTAPFSRYMFLFTPYFALVSAAALDMNFRRGAVSVPAIIISLVLFLAVYSYYFFTPAAIMPNHKFVPAAHIAGGCAMCLILFFKSGKKEFSFSKWLLPALTAVLVLNITVDSFSSFYNRDTVLKGGEYFSSLYDEDTEEALDFLKSSDSEYYRTEKTYGATISMDSLVQGYHPVSTYNSTQNRNIQNYVLHDWPDLLYNDYNHYVYVLGCVNEEQSDLTGIKYVLAKTADAGIPGFETYKQFGSVTLYRNTSVTNIASFYDEAAVSATYGTDSDGYTPTVTMAFSQRDEEAAISLKDSVKDDRIEGTVSAPQDGILFLAIPYEHGWSVSIDGVRQELLKADEGFTAVRVGKGEHTVTVSYLCPGLVKGAAISAFSLGLFIVFLGIGKIRRKKNAADHSLQSA